MDDIFKELKVVELASVLAGPAVGMFFAELGAQVIKIENKRTEGDITRKWKHPLESNQNELSAYYHSINWGKKSILLDLSNSEEYKTAIDCITEADIVISNFLPSSADKLGFSYKTLKGINPKLIFGHISAYGSEDPRPGFDALMQAETGWMSINGDKNGLPTKMPVALIDILAAHQLKAGILSAYIHLLKTGKGSMVSVSLFDSAIASLANQASNYLNLNVVPNRQGSLHPNIAPYGEIVRTKNDKLILLAIGNQKQFESLLDILNLETLKTDTKYLTNHQRVKNRSSLLNELQTAFTKFDESTILKLAAEAKIPLGAINNIRTVLDHPAAQKLILEEPLTNGQISKRVKTAVFKLSE